MGRIPKLVKERALREQREQKLREEAALAEATERGDELRPRESSCSSSSDRSIENDDPDAIELGSLRTRKQIVLSRRWKLKRTFFFLF